MRLPRVVVATGAAVLALAVAGPASAEERVVEVLLPDRAALEELAASGADLDHGVTERNGKLVVPFVGEDEEIALLRAQGYEIGNELWSESVSRARLAERERTIKEKRAKATAQEVTAAEGVKILNAVWYTTTSGEVLYVEAKSAEGDDDTLTMRWDSGAGTDLGSGGEATLSDFVDIGVYMYHERQVSVDTRPSRVEVTSELTGESVVADVTEWVPPLKGDNGKDPYLRDFVDHYMDPTELYARIESLAEQFPDIAEIVELPNKTNGYRRPAQTVFGSLSSSTNSPGNPSAVSVSSIAYGSEGGNGITVETRDPGAANAPLAVAVNGRDIVVSLATDASGAVTSTAAQVVAAINGSAAAAQLVLAHLPRDNAGAGVVAPAGPQTLTDNLDAPAHVSRDPFTVRALRIGKHRDGSKLGVLAYSQEHAREWQTPLVSIEAAERLVRNYAIDGDTKRLVNELDIFVIPSVNPDGAHFSFYDRPSQRRNMTYRCTGLRFFDQVMADSRWGVDLNRNHTIGSAYDGYAGASTIFTTTGCLGDTFAGPEEHSEPEAQNLAWLAETHPNIKFAMNVHSSGNFFMWPPGAYKPGTREPLPRPTLGEEEYFWHAADHILGRVKEQRGLTVPLSRTGPVIDVLYSAAGNSADEVWYKHGIYGWDFEVGISFQPAWEEAEQEALEFANGLIGLFEVAYDFAKDGQPPKVETVPGQGTYGGPVDLTFETSEPATVYYTLDGSKPTTNSTVYASAGVREGGEVIELAETTTVRWFGVDAAGNASPVKSSRVIISP
jgi:hypothetical protein